MAELRAENVDLRTVRHRLALNDAPVSWRELADGLQQDPALRAVLTAAVAGCPWRACYFETPASSRATLDRPFELVLVDAPALDAARPDPRPFAGHFAGSPETVLEFDNLGGDARLVVPRPLADPEVYTHLARFVRRGPPAQVDELWQQVGRALTRRWAASDAPVWLGTSGGGVAWLHVRLDARPKYYAHAPYRAPP